MIKRKHVLWAWRPNPIKPRSWAALRPATRRHSPAKPDPNRQRFSDARISLSFLQDPGRERERAVEVALALGRGGGGQGDSPCKASGNEQNTILDRCRPTRPGSLLPFPACSIILPPTRTVGWNAEHALRCAGVWISLCKYPLELDR